MEFILKLLLIFFLVLLNGFFVSAEFALVAVRKTYIAQLAKKGNRAAGAVHKGLQHLDTYISATQLGITIASIALGWVGEPALASFFENQFHTLPKTMAFISAHTLATTIAFSIITYLHIVIGELAPKTLALQQAEKTSLFIIYPLQLFTTIFKPAILLLNYSGSFFLRIVGLHSAEKNQVNYSPEEIKLIIAQSAKQGLLPKNEVEMVQNVFRFGDTPVKEIMIPCKSLIAFDGDTKLADIRKNIINYPYSRYPVYRKNIDTILGYVHIRDLVLYSHSELAPIRLKNAPFIRPIFYVSELRRVDDVLLDMRKKRIHIAIVRNQNGKNTGLVTLEDTIESLVGEIEDEFDRPIKK